jgi:CheY-like chemotaxis protein/ferredoxin
MAAPESRILIAEDEPDMRFGLSRSLSKRGHTVDLAEDGLQAVERMEVESYDIVIADLKMPRLDGLGVLRRGREIRPSAVFIFITGYGTTETAAEAMRLGAFDYIAKPFSMDQLTSVIDEAAKMTRPTEAPGEEARRLIPHENMPAFIEHLMEQAPVLAPTAKGESRVFARIERASDVVLDYTSTILPPKKLLLPQEEPLFTFDRKAAEAAKPEEAPRDAILFGVHPCDMQGILRLDLAFTEGEPESNYLARRRGTAFVGVSCQPDDHCSCQLLGAYDTRGGFDLFLTKLRTGYVLDVMTAKGAALLEGFRSLYDVTAEAFAEAEAVNLGNARPRTALGCHAGASPELLKLASQDELWEEVAGKCLSCGACSLVCPTCFCFDVTDRLQLNLRHGTRYRRWDSCQLGDFAAVATGENFRESREERARHRFAHKFLYFAEKFGTSMCVGCGRCVRACPADISPVEIVSGLCERNEAALLAKVCSFAQ